MRDFWTNPVVRGAITGLCSAIYVDAAAWRNAERDDDGKLPVFDWQVAIRRYVGGLITGGLAGAGYASVTGE